MRQWIVDEVLTRVAPALLIAFLAVPTAANAELPKYQFNVIDIGQLGCSMSRPYDINEAGAAVGECFSHDGLARGWLYSDGALTAVGPVGDDITGTRAYALNDAGQIVGSYHTRAGEQRGFLQQNGAVDQIPSLGGAFTIPSDINEAGQVVGHARTQEGFDHAFIYEEGITRDLGALIGGWSSAFAINESGQVAISAPSKVFLYSDDTMIEVPAPPGATRLRITPPPFGRPLNNQGQIAGALITSSGEGHAFIYSEGVTTDLGSLIAGNSDATAINDVGQMTGFHYYTQDNRGFVSAFFYNNGEMISLGGGRAVAGQCLNNQGEATGEYAFVFDYRDRSLVYASPPGMGRAGFDINESGQVVGVYSLPPDYLREYPYIATPIRLLFSHLLHDVTGVGPGKSLANSVRDASTYYKAEDLLGTCSALDYFITLVNDFSTGKKPKITATRAEGFIEDGQAIQDAVGCP